MIRRKAERQFGYLRSLAELIARAFAAFGLALSIDLLILGADSK